MGAGTVGVRDADVLSSLGIPIAMCKYNADENDIKTKELKELISRYSDIDIYAARGSNLGERVINIREKVGKCEGGIGRARFEDIVLTIDASPKGIDVRNHLEIYTPNRLKFAVNGGGDDKLVHSLYFASVPNSRVQDSFEEYKKENAKIVSCNTHCLTAFFGLLKNVIGKNKDFKNHIQDKICVNFFRRHEDPHKDKAKPNYVTITHKDYHVKEVEDLIPESKGLLDTMYSKWPTEYFHNLEISITLKDKLSSELLDDIKLEIQNYPRAILSENELSHEKVIKSAEWAGVQDGDIPFPVYMVTQRGKHKLCADALTPQRGIVAPSTADYVLLRTGLIKGPETWEEIFNYVNQNAKFRGKDFYHIKNSIQDNLINYEKMEKKFRD